MRAAGILRICSLTTSVTTGDLNGATTSERGSEPVYRAGFESATRKAYEDVRDGFGAWRIWTRLAFQDIRFRYRGSVIGPFWLTISMAVMISGLGMLYSQIFGVSVREYFPWVAFGLVSWSLVSSLINEGCQVFISNGSIIRQNRIPFTAFPMRLCLRALLVFIHHTPIFILVMLILGVQVTFSLLFVLPGVATILVAGFFSSLFLGLFSVRFRDVPQIIASIIQIGFFLTPIIWRPDSGRGEVIGRIFVDFNPFAHFISLIREPLLGHSPPWASFGICWGLIAAMAILSLATFRRFRSRIPYWV